MKIDEVGRRALVVALAQRARLGRTAIMKLMFFLQELRGVPLYYDFRIYTYGPYDGQVLEDLRLTEALGGVVCNKVVWSGGSGVEIAPGCRASEILANAKSLISTLESDLDWVTSEFGNRSAADLEILSTIVFIDKRVEGCLESHALASRVHSLKPHHSLAKITKEVEGLYRQRFLVSLC